MLHTSSSLNKLEYNSSLAKQQKGAHQQKSNYNDKIKDFQHFQKSQLQKIKWICYAFQIIIKACWTLEIKSYLILNEAQISN